MDSQYEEIDIKNNFDEFWGIFEDFRNLRSNISPFYNQNYFLYQEEYCKSNNYYIGNESFMIIKKNYLLCAYVFLTNKNDNGLIECNYGFDLPGLIIINENIDKKLLSKFLNKILFLKNSFHNISFTIPPFQEINKGYEEVFKNFNLKNKVKWYRSIDLSKTEEYLWRNIRKSYKSAINKGIREQEIILIDHNNFNIGILKEIKTLHHKVSGKVTRSQKSWDIQFDSIKNDFGFVFCSFKNEEILSAVYFIKSESNAYYSVGIFTDQSKKSMYGHCLLWESVKYCKSRGLNFCELDIDIKFNSLNENEHKLSQISYFKSGFGGSIHPRHEFLII